MIKKYQNIEYIIVCGGAPGIHYNLLSDMYPHITFILYDAVKFYKKLYNKNNIILKNYYFNTFIAHNIKFENSVFISDMRSLEVEHTKGSYDFNKDSIYLADMYQQLAYFQLTSCKACMLKFKVPLTLNIPYLNGTILCQPFIYSNETRLITYKNEEINYFNGQDIENKLQMINNYWKSYKLELTKDEQEWIDKYKIENNWDNIALYHILNDSNNMNYIDKILQLFTK